MNVTRAIETLFKRFLPSPFTIAVLLTLLAIVLALPLVVATDEEPRLLKVLSFWEDGIWNDGLLVFAYQMMLILVLGHVLVLSRPASSLIKLLTNYVNDTKSAVILVSVSTMSLAFFNWGLGLIFGAIMARKVAESAQIRGFQINYPLVGAAGYMGLMIWHGGMSGSAPLKVSEPGHLKDLMSGISEASIVASLPDAISTYQTVFSWWNLLLFLVLLMIIPIVLSLIAKRMAPTPLDLPVYDHKIDEEGTRGMARLEHSMMLPMIFGSFILLALGYNYWDQLRSFTLTPNMLNFFMLGMAMLMHRSIRRFLSAVEEAIKGTSGILIQFPLYFGVMGIMKGSGMIQVISDFFVSVANDTTLPIFTFFSAGLVNIFVPSGGGQWAVQGPIVVESALKLGVPLPKIVMALAYGDQVTNMLQPFWALPLLGITKLKAKEILPYTLMAMLVASVIFIVGLLMV